jgi:hypothetical protein
MKKFLKFQILIAAMLACSLMVACGDDDNGDGWFNGTISGTVENANEFPNVRRIAATISFSEDDRISLAYGNFSNGRFTITLPQTMDARYLEDISDFSFIDAGKLPDNISNRNARLGTFWNLIGISSSSGAFSWDDWVTEVKYGKLHDDGDWLSTWVRFVYSDSNVTITGSHTERGTSWEETYSYDLSLKRGWNRIYCTYKYESGSELYSFSSKSVSGLRWYFFD